MEESTFGIKIKLIRTQSLLLRKALQWMSYLCTKIMENS